MKKILNILEGLNKNLIISIPASMVVGILIGYLFNCAILKTTIIPFTFLMVYPMMVGLNIKELFTAGGAKANIIAIVLNFAVMPFIAFGAGNFFFNDAPALFIGLFLSALLPTSGMTISWTGFAKGNINTAIKMTVIGLIAGSLATPIYMKAMLGAIVEIPMKDIFIQIILIVFLPMILGILTQKILINKFGQEKFKFDIKPKLPVFSTIGVLGIVFVAMALKAEVIIKNPVLLLKTLIPLILLYGINFILSTIVGKLTLKRGEAIALVYGTVMRNLSIALAVAMTVFKEKGSDIAIIISMAYIIQVQAAAWYVKYTDKFFGKETV